MPPPPYLVTVAERDPPRHSCTVGLHDKPPTPSEGGGGWEEIALEKRAAVLVWKGRGLLKMTFSVVFDGTEDGRPVDEPLPSGIVPRESNQGAGGWVRIKASPPAASTFTTLLHFWRPAEPVEPPVVSLHSLGNVIPYTEGMDYVVTGLEWGEAVGDEQGRRIQQILNLSFTEYRPAEKLLTAAAAAKAKSKRDRAQVHIVAKGETLDTIARHYKVRGGWRGLGMAQHPRIRDPRNVKVGHPIVIPSDATMRKLLA
jgi:hypothetical protein